ncbi:MAG: family 16 glycosylhydrolase [Alphaproteobacteria bacterium]
MPLNNLRLTFRDEFNSLSLDTGTAATQANFWNSSMHNGYIRSLAGNNEKQIYMDADYLGLGVNPFSVNDGILTINAAKSSSAVKAATGYDYTSGVLTSQGAFSQTYGYWEVRAQIPEGKGLWSAFWLLNENENWPPELDILEAIGSETNWLHQTVHTATGSATSAPTWSVDKLSQGYHTYGMNWTQHEITFYLDGRATFTMPTPTDVHTPMYMVLNLAVGGNWPGSPDATTNWANAKYNVDYVRVYEHTGAATNGYLNPDGSVYVPPAALQLAGLIISNGGDVTGMTGIKFAAPDTGPSTSKTYTAAQLGLGTPSSATLTVAYDAQKNVAVANNGKWNDIKNGAYASDTVKGVTLTNFVDVSVHMNGDQDARVTVKDAKRGKIITTGGNDTIVVDAWSNGTTDNTFIIDTGGGNDSIAFSGADNTRAAIKAGGGNDTISFSGMANGSANGEGGDDRFVIRSGGLVTLTGGGGADSYDLAAGNRVTVTDFKIGEDSLSFNGVAAGALKVRHANGNTYIDVNNVNAATLTGVTASLADLAGGGVSAPPPPAPVTIPVFDAKTATPTALLTPEASFTNWPIVHAKLSNGDTISTAGGASFAAAESGASSAKTYSASQIGLGSEAGTSVTIAYDAAKNVTVTNNGAWGGIDNVAIRSGAMTKMTVSNFAGVDLDINANQHSAISVSGAKYGSIATGGGNDTINVTGSSDGVSNNLLTISAGNGANTVNYSGGANNRAAIIAGAGNDTITFAGQADGAINAGAGNDRINIRSTGNVAVTGGAGADVFSFIAGAHATIADFNAGEDRLEFSGVSASNVQVRNNGVSTVIDLNGQSAVVLSGVALSASQLNLSYV